MLVFSNGKRHLLDERRLAQTQASSKRSFPLRICLHGPDREGAWKGRRGQGCYLWRVNLCVPFTHSPYVIPESQIMRELCLQREAGREIIRTFCKSFWRHCKRREEIACNGAYSAVTNGIRWLQQEMTERELTILSSISKVPINNRKHSCSIFPASSYCQKQATQFSVWAVCPAVLLLFPRGWLFQAVPPMEPSSFHFFSIRAHLAAFPP